MAPIGWGKLAGQAGVKVIPVSVLFHTPPEALAAYSVPAVEGSGAMYLMKWPQMSPLFDDPGNGQGWLFEHEAPSQPVM